MKKMKQIRKMIKKLKGEYNRVSFLLDQAGKNLMELGKVIYEKKSSPESLQDFSETIFQLEELITTNEFLGDYEPMVVYQMGYKIEKLHHLAATLTSLLADQEFERARLYLRILLTELEELRNLVLE